MAEFKIGQNTVKNKKKKPFSIGQNTKKSKKSKDKKEVGRNTVKGRSIGAAIMTILSAPAGFKIGQNTKKELKNVEKALPRAMSPGPKKKKKLPKVSAKQKAKNEKRANIREGQRGKVGSKRNVIKTSTGILRDKSGKAVKGGSKSAFQKRMEERKRSGGK